ncbi:nickel-type superoxide dismutase maturation protease [Wenjunlia tyrosinilytica]|uniref:S26 family signal peptidase n=1 Tax=Wenjunlia tyrosinilytica TaxID=1544741 RepID=A0A917ZKS6_9ACTN|nr:nickel-type superoxide dismutase maturation protease [Wenjunlia tyrosinilytica]GGO85546.1 S26 family signal peptidase [Wenjunlia tyrosinilytica]
MRTEDTAVAAAPPLGWAAVRGPSMVPTFRDGDQLLVRYGVAVRPGDVVVARHPFQQDLLVVKRAVGRRDGGWWLLGDNPYVPNDSREFGTVPAELVLGRVLGRYRPRKGYSSTAAWLLGAVRPVGVERSFSRRLRAR